MAIPEKCECGFDITIVLDSEKAEVLAMAHTIRGFQHLISMMRVMLVPSEDKDCVFFELNQWTPDEFIKHTPASIKLGWLNPETLNVKEVTLSPLH